MSKKDYIALAEAIQSSRAKMNRVFPSAEDTIHGILSQVTQDIADVLARDNSAFDRERFLAAALRGEWTRAAGHNNRARKGA